MTEKNRGRLRQLDDPKNVRLLLDLPQRLVRKAKKLDRGRRDDALDSGRINRGAEQV